MIEKRQAESVKIMEKFHERIPVIIEKATTEQKLPELDQQKYAYQCSYKIYRFLIPFDFTFQQFLQVIRKRMSLEKE